MKICLVHNFYQWPGGEDRVFAEEGSLLTSRGHEVIRFTRHNDSVKQMNLVTLGLNTVWSRSAASDLGSLLKRECPDVVHFHNTLPLISPAAYYSVRRQGAAVVQTLHNYRLLCPAATLLRDGSICEDCVGHKFAWPAVSHACYKENRAASATISAMLFVHHLLGTWKKTVDCFIALTEFAKGKFTEGGLPADRIFVKPNHCSDQNDMVLSKLPRSGGLFVGQLNEVKGIETMLDAWQTLTMPLTVIGDGPLTSRMQSSEQINFVGQKSSSEVIAAMQRALFLVFPSIWYEGFPMVIAEAFSQGLPVIVSRLGGLPELVEDGVTGLHFTPGDSKDLIEKVSWAVNHREEMKKMRRNTRAVYLEKYTPEANYPQLIAIYESAMAQAERRRN